jgi:hypothetical protein
MSSVISPTGSAGVRKRLSGQGMMALAGILGLQRAPRLRVYTIEGHDTVQVVVLVLRADRRRAFQTAVRDLHRRALSNAS